MKVERQRRCFQTIPTMAKLLTMFSTVAQETSRQETRHLSLHCTNNIVSTHCQYHHRRAAPPRGPRPTTATSLAASKWMATGTKIYTRTDPGHSLALGRVRYLINMLPFSAFLRKSAIFVLWKSPHMIFQLQEKKSVNNFFSLKFFSVEKNCFV